MTISIIAAVSKNGVIGKAGHLPWHLPADMAYFKATTTGHAVIMGRKSYESLPAAYRPLPERRNIVLSRQRNLHLEKGVEVAHSLEAAFEMAKADTLKDEIFVIGGGEVYAAALPHARKLYLTRVEADIKGGGTLFPSYDTQEWQTCEKVVKHPKDDKHRYAFAHFVYERVPSAVKKNNFCEAVH